MNIAASSAKQTILNSLLTEGEFSKMQRTIDLNEEGVLAESVQGKNGSKKSAALFCKELDFSFKPFRFDGTECERESGQVLFTGKGFDGRPLLGILQGSDKGEAARAVYALSACVKRAMEKNVFIPANGAGGILYKQSKGKLSLLFLPQKLFEAAARNANDFDYAALQGAWQDKNLSGHRAAAFVRAAAVYQALSGSLPFAQEDLEARQADILDARYLPLKNKVNGASEKLSEQISYALEYGSAAFEEKLRASELGTKNSGGGENGEIEWLDKDFCLEELSKELGLNADGSVLQNVERKAAVSQKEFEEEAKRILQKKSAKAGASRTLRRNRAAFIASLFFIAAAIFFARSVYNDKLMRPTTISLDERESAEVFFSGLHSMDTILMQAASSGKEARAFVDSIGNLYVASKMRDAFSQTVGTVCPELYVYREDLSDKWIFGITNFMLAENGSALEEADNRKSAPSRKQKPRPLAVPDGAKAALNVQYFLVHNEGPESDITAEKLLGGVELTFKKNRWLVTGFSLSPQKRSYSLKEFLDDRASALKECSGDAVAAAKILKEKYEWIPSAKEMAAARIEHETRMKKDD